MFSFILLIFWIIASFELVMITQNKAHHTEHSIHYYKLNCENEKF